MTPGGAWKAMGGPCPAGDMCRMIIMFTQARGRWNGTGGISSPPIRTIDIQIDESLRKTSAYRIEWNVCVHQGQIGR